jgi:nickel/cobalt exporter
MELVSNAYLAALLLGAIHALEVDHMIAVSAFVGSEPRTRTAAWFGARWGVGHSAVVLLVGGALAWFEIRIPDSFVVWGEMVVGMALVFLGFWAVRAAKHFHLHGPDEHEGHGHLHQHRGDSSGHRHSHDAGSKHHHRHMATAMGALHGLVGTAPILALIPVALIQDFGTAMIYLTLFGVGTITSMTAYATFAALAVQGMATNVILRVSYLIAGGTVGVGMWWIYRSLGLLVL